jgi:hypothetical protein
LALHHAGLGSQGVAGGAAVAVVAGVALACMVMAASCCCCFNIDALLWLLLPCTLHLIAKGTNINKASQ